MPILDSELLIMSLPIMDAEMLREHLASLTSAASNDRTRRRNVLTEACEVAVTSGDAKARAQHQKLVDDAVARRDAACDKLELARAERDKLEDAKDQLEMLKATQHDPNLMTPEVIKQLNGLGMLLLKK